jgi:hypothetical protein
VALCNNPDILPAANLSIEKEPEPYDHHCPKMGRGLNYRKKACLVRQTPPGGCSSGDGCKQGNIVLEENGLPARKIKTKAPPQPCHVCGSPEIMEGWRTLVPRPGEPICIVCHAQRRTTFLQARLALTRSRHIRTACVREIEMQKRIIERGRDDE